MSTLPYWDKAEEALEAAQILLEHGCENSAVNRAYYAVFHAARAALIAAGEGAAHQNWSHQAIQGQFQRLTRLRKVYPAHMNADLTDLRGARERADYEPGMVPSKQSRKAVKDASAFIANVRKETQL